MNTSLNNERKSVPILYIVVPCFNEEEGISKTAEVLQAKMNYLMNQKLIHSYSKVIFVDDGSKDSTWNLIASFNRKNPSLFGGVKLAHNRGHQNALLSLIHI